MSIFPFSSTRPAATYVAFTQAAHLAEPRSRRRPRAAARDWDRVGYQGLPTMPREAR